MEATLLPAPGRGRGTLQQDTEQQGAAPRPALPMGSQQGLCRVSVCVATARHTVHLHHRLRGLPGAATADARAGSSWGICPVKEPRCRSTEKADLGGSWHGLLGHPSGTSAAPHLPGPRQPAPGNRTAGRGQPGRVIPGTAALISGQTSRITARHGCSESGNMVSDPAVSTQQP